MKLELHSQCPIARMEIGYSLKSWPAQPRHMVLFLFFDSVLSGMCGSGSSQGVTLFVFYNKCPYFMGQETNVDILELLHISITTVHSG